MTTPKSLFSFPSGEDCYEINTADWVMVSCLNGRTTFQLKTKEFTIDGGKITKDQVKPKADFQAVDSPKKWTDKFVLFAFLLLTANKSNSFVWFLGESMARQSCFRFNLAFGIDNELDLNFDRTTVSTIVKV